MLARSPLVHRWSLLACLVLAAGAGLGFWAYRTIYLPRYGYTENAILSADHITGFQTMDKVILRIRLLNAGGRELRGTLHLELTDPKGKVLGERDKIITQTEAAADYHVEIPAHPLAAEKVTLRCSFGSQRLAVSLSRVLAVKVHETSLTANREFIAGTPAALRCGVDLVQSLWGDMALVNAEVPTGKRKRKRTVVQRTPETSPLMSATVRVNLYAKDGTVYPLHKGMTGKDGWDQAEFIVPTVPPGAYTLQVTTRSDLGEESLEQSVRVKVPVDIVLATDKSVYQPGQVIHVRARVCRPFDRKPWAGATLALTVEDARGNRIFEHTQSTAADGSAAVDYPLTDDAPVGAYRIHAALGDHRAEMTINVQRPERPRFRVNLTADKRYYLPGETIHAEAQVDYSAGKPVVGATLEGTAMVADASKPFTTWKGAVDSHGHARWDIKLPKDFGGQAPRNRQGEVRLTVKATDLADHAETVRRSFSVSDQPIRVSLIPAGGRLVPELENHVYIVAIYPDGRPAPCAVILRQGADPRGQILTSVQTSAAGLAECRFTPRKAGFRAGPRHAHVKEILGHRPEIEQIPELLFDLVVEARDAHNTTAQSLMTLSGRPLGENLALRLDRTIYRSGDMLRFEVLATPGLTRPYVDVVRDGQLVLTRNLKARDGVAEVRLELPSALAGTLEIHAYQAINTGEVLRAGRIIYVTPDASSGKQVPLAGGPGRLRFRATEAAAGEITVDESTYPLADLPPGLEKVYATLQEEWLKSTARETAPLLRDFGVAANQQQLAGAMLAAVRPRPPQTWIVEPAVQRHYKLYDQARRIAWAIVAYARSGRPFMDYEPRSRRWIFRPNLLQEMVTARALDASLLDGPIGGKLILDDLPRWDATYTVDRVAELVTWERCQRLVEMVGKYTADRPEFHQASRWTFPATLLADAVRSLKQDPRVLKDAWGEPIHLVRRPIKQDNKTGLAQFDFYELVSAGPDRVFNTADDLRLFNPNLRQRVGAPLFGLNLADYLAGALASPEALVPGTSR